MPQPFSGGIIYGPNTLRKQPAIAIEIANITCNWAIVESNLLRLYALVMGSYLPSLPADQDDPNQKWAPRHHPVAYLTFDALVTISAKLDVLERLLEERAEPAEFARYRDALKSKIRKRAGERNLVAHAVWCQGIDIRGDDVQVVSDGVILKPIIGQTMIYRLTDFQAINDRILELNREIFDFTKPIDARMFERVNTHPPGNPKLPDKPE